MADHDVPKTNSSALFDSVDLVLESPQVEPSDDDLRSGASFTDSAEVLALENNQLNFSDPAGASFTDSAFVTENEDQHVDSSDEDAQLKPHIGILDSVTALLGGVAFYNPYTPTLDDEGHQHLVGDSVYFGFYYDRTGEPWSNPTAHPTFSGYAADGTKYTSGVQDGGPVLAPWSSEAAGADRSSRSDWPVKSLIVFSRYEVNIYDLDDFESVGDLTLFWRARIGTSGGGTFALFGRVGLSMQSAAMKNGLLVVVSKHNGTENGGTFLVDFKRDGIDQDWAQLVRADNHWRAGAAQSTQGRNASPGWTTGGTTGKRVRGESLYSVAITDDPTDITRQWVAIGSDDSFEVVETSETNQPTFVYNSNPDLTVNEVSRSVTFDKSRFLWLMENNKVWCCLHDYRGGSIGHAFTSDSNATIENRYPRCKLFDSDSISIVAGGRNLYVNSARGIWQIALNQPGRMVAELAYTISGNGGRAEILPNVKEFAYGDRLQVFPGSHTDLLLASTVWGEGGIALIQTATDTTFVSKIYPAISEDGSSMFVGYPVS